MAARKTLQVLSIPLLCSAIIMAIFTVMVPVRSQKTTKLVTNEVVDTNGNFDPTAKMARFFGQDVSVPAEIKTTQTKVLGDSNSDNKWIEVDLSEQKIKAWDGGSLYLESLVSTGLPSTPTPTGEFRIWYKTKYTRMRGGQGKSAYDLPNVPYTMFFENSAVPGWRGYGLHGAYWHNDFGKVRSHGCINLPIPVAEKLFYWASPVLASGNAIRSSDSNVGTKLVVHE